jgi:aminopeptidase N
MKIRNLVIIPLLLSGLSTSALRTQAPVDAIHYKLEIELLFTSKSIQGTQHATFKSLMNGLKTVDLDLYSGYAIASVKLGTKSLTFSRPANKISVTLDRTYNLNEQFTLDIAYSGSPPTSSGFGGMVFTTHSGSPMCWTLSEPWDAKLWWPGRDTLGDKSTFEMWITHPDTMLAASNGLLQGTDKLAGNRLRTRWQEKYPIIPYLVSLAVTNYRKRVDTYTGMGANMPVEFYVFPEYWNSWQNGMNAIVPMLDAFSKVFGQYPFVNEKYGIAQFTWGGGMEHQTISSQSSVAEWLSAHELGHAWWGDAITCKTWHDIWLNEGFATFCEAVWAERKLGGSLAAYRSYMIGRKPYRVDGTVYVYNPTSVNTIFSSTNVYRKGGWVVHMLRGALGETMFWKVLADYRKAFEGGSADTRDFEKSLSKTVGKDMNWFIDQWVKKNGAPTYNTGWSANVIGGKDYVYLQMNQSQSYQSVYTMPVRIRVGTTKGTEEHTVWNDSRQDAFVIPVGAPATSISVDPDQWILRPTPRTMSYARPFFAMTDKELDVVAGGNTELHFDRGATDKDRFYLMLSSASGTVPGTKLPSVHIPLNLDAMTTLGLGALNTPIFATFLGKLDAQGTGRSTFMLPPGLGLPLRGKTLSFAYVLADRFDAASPAVHLQLR